MLILGPAYLGTFYAYPGTFDAYLETFDAYLGTFDAYPGTMARKSLYESCLFNAEVISPSVLLRTWKRTYKLETDSSDDSETDPII